jgi:N-acetyl-gamma-glutamyl-phosphate reductase
MSMDRVCEKADVVFTALPHKLPMTIVPELLNHGKKVIDLSADFRFEDAVVYESFYDPHQAKDLLEKAVYGLCEIYVELIKNATLIGVPGCYPTSVLLPLIPLVKSRLIDNDSIVADSKSGVSGAGRSLSLTTHFCEANESFKAYKVASHRHNPEMEMILSREAGSSIMLTFVPHLVPMTRGILTTIYARINQKVSREDIHDCISSFYADCPFIRIFNEDRPPDTLYVRGTNYCDIGFKLDQRNRRLILISAIDNLIKGASGQAVQNMNMMLGFDETSGLLGVPFPI